jgi:arsenite-transporting ATPase
MLILQLLLAAAAVVLLHSNGNNSSSSSSSSSSSNAGGGALTFCWAFSNNLYSYHHHPRQQRQNVLQDSRLPSSSSPLLKQHDVNLLRNRRRSSMRLFSLQPLIDEISIMIAESRKANNDDDDANNDNTPVIFVGGKGGVGKTSISSALAVELASRGSAANDDEEEDWNVLIISTDPAHSLGDALDVDLRHSASSVSEQQQPITLSDTITNQHLHALEVDPKLALIAFQASIQQLFNDDDDDTTTFQIGGMSLTTILNEIGLGKNELDALVRNPPPGLDEYVALANVLDPNFINNNNNNDDDYNSAAGSSSSGSRGRKKKTKYDVIIVDTAPTGHTLRMLQY